MATTKSKSYILHTTTFAIFNLETAGDLDILPNFIVPPSTTAISANFFFTFTGMRVLVGADPPATFEVLKASMAEFPALNGQSVSYSVLEFPAGFVNPVHTHPCASESEHLFLFTGSLEVGFVNTTNKLLAQSLQEGDLFVFPKGLAYNQFNMDLKNPALAVSAFGSASAGTVLVPGAVFNTSIEMMVY